MNARAIVLAVLALVALSLAGGVVIASTKGPAGTMIEAKCKGCCGENCTEKECASDERCDSGCEDGTPYAVCSTN